MSNALGYQEKVDVTHGDLGGRLRRQLATQVASFPFPRDYNNFNGKTSANIETNIDLVRTVCFKVFNPVWTLAGPSFSDEVCPGIDKKLGIRLKIVRTPYRQDPFCQYADLILLTILYTRE